MAVHKLRSGNMVGKVEASLVLTGLRQPAKREGEEFLKRYKAYLEHLYDISLSILIWGKDPRSRSLIARKRSDIRRALAKLGHNAMFSEDIKTRAGFVSEKTKELAQALAAHLIIILVEDSPGALGEFQEFSFHPDISHKLFLMVPQNYKRGYAGNGAIKDLEEAYKGVYWYADEDLDVCTVLTEAVKWVEARRRMEYYWRVGKHNYGTA